MEYGHPILLYFKKIAINKIESAETSTIRSLIRIRHPDYPAVFYFMKKTYSIPEVIGSLIITKRFLGGMSNEDVD